MKVRKRTILACAAAGLALLTSSAQAGSITYNFDTTPIGVLEIRGNDASGAPWDAATGVPRWQATNGNPATGGFLALCYAQNYFNTHVLFPDLDPGKVVTAFHFECDLRVGNSQGDRGADGFSINFARSYDPVIEHWDDADPGRGYRGDGITQPCPGCEVLSIPETGTRTGIAISFDTWSGNTLNDGADLEGIIIAVDGATVLSGTARGTALPTRHGACADNTSLQTGPRDPAFWANEFTADAEAIHTPAAWDTLCWQRFVVDLDAAGKLTVSWKGRTLLDKYQTTYFPTAGRLIFGGRTGGANEVTHVDNIVLTTTAVAAESQPPTDPANLRAVELGSRHVNLQWDPSVERPDPQARLAYQVSRDGKVIASTVTDTNYVDAPGPDLDSWNQLKPSTAYTYSVLARDLNENKSGSVTATVTTAAEVATPGWFIGQVYTNVTGVLIGDLYAAEGFPNSPGKQGWWMNGLSFNQPSGSWGENFGFRYTGTLTAPKTGKYRFFVRSDDASAFWLNTAGAAVPDIGASYAIAEETDCCDAFQEPGIFNDDGSTYPTSDPVSLTAGQKYGFVWLVKEGTGGDNGQVAWRLEGDTTAAASLPPIGGAFIDPAGGLADPGGASVTITTDVQDVTAAENQAVTLAPVIAATSPWGYGATYQWFKDGAPLMNANAGSLSIPFPTMADAGKYKLLASVPGASATTREATVTVTADSNPPAIVRAYGNATWNGVTVVFTEPVSGANVAGNYSFTPALSVTSATVAADNRTVTLATGAQGNYAEYKLTVSNVRDTAQAGGNTIAAPGNQFTFRAFGEIPGILKFEVWNGLPTGDNSIDNTLLADSRYPASPDVVANTTAYNTRPVYGDDSHEGYGGRMSGWLKPTESGSYRFFIYSDDSSRLFLSTDETEAKAVMIAEETGCCNFFTEPGTPRTSEPIPLVAGKKYYTYALWKEGTGGDYCQVAWRKEGDTTAAGSLSPIPGTYLAGIGDPEAGAPTLATQPKNGAVAQGGSTTLSVGATLGEKPFTYQWRKNGVAIPGATGPSYTIEGASAEDVGVYDAVVKNAAATVTSGMALVTLENTFLIEAEDFNYDGGKAKPEASVMPYLGGAYNGLGAKLNVDYGSNDDNSDTSYRAVAVAKGGEQNKNMNGNLGGRLGKTRGAWEVTSNYKLGWTDTADWGNYTRTFPAGDYEVLAALSHGDGPGNATAMRGTLGLVTAGATTANQTLEPLGKFVAPGSGGWGSNELVPMVDDAGATKVISLSGDQTVRFTMDSGDFDYLLFVPAVAGANIAWVSFHPADGTPSVDATAAGFTEAPDVGYTKFLAASGHKVTRIVTSGTPDVALLNTFDLVIISRSVPSGDYQDPPETLAWNGLTAPAMIVNGYLLRNSRLGFVTAANLPDVNSPAVALKVNDPAHPIFAGIQLDANNLMVNAYANLVSYTNAVQRGISANTDPLADAGTMLATIGTTGDAAFGGLAIAEWQAGSKLANTAGNTLGGHRLVFLTGSREQGITSQGAGIFDLTADGQKMFLSAVKYMAAAPAAGPKFTTIKLNANGSITIEWTGGGTLQAASNVSGPWQDVAGATSPYTLTPTDAMLFGRIRQ